MSGPDPGELWTHVCGWLDVAAVDERAARLSLAADPPLPTVAAFHCQQAAEKLLKGLLVRALIDFGKTHDLERLGRPVTGRYPDLAPLVKPMRDWTAWSVAYRYPAESGPEPEPPRAELEAALRLIAQLAAAARALGPPGPGPEDGTGAAGAPV